MSSYDDYDYDDDDEDPLPLLSAELYRRSLRVVEDPSSRTEPAPIEIVQMFREYIEKNGEDDDDTFRYGGFLDTMDRLGHVPRSTDPLCAARYNLHGIFEKDTPPPWEKMLLTHEAKVRLLRYGEFNRDILDAQGLSPPEDWQFLDKELPPVTFFPDHDNDASIVTKELETYLTKDQLVAFTKSIMSEFIFGVSPQALQELADCSVAIPSGKMNVIVDFGFDTLLEQCQKLQELYSEKSKPLVGQHYGQEHQDFIHQCFGSMTQTILDHFSDTGAVADLICHWANMMMAGCVADIAIARAILKKPKVVIQVREMALKAAHSLERDERRPKWVLHSWWEAFDSLNDLCIGVIGTFSPPEGYEFSKKKVISESTVDGKAVHNYYWKHVEPMVWKSLQGGNISEQSCVMGSVNDLLSLGYKASVSFIKPEKWNILEGFTQDREPPEDLNGGQKELFDAEAPHLIRNTIQFLVMMAARGMSTNEMGQIVPGPLVHKLVSRGLIGVLTQVAESPLEPAAILAVDGLAQLTRVKDCRLYLLKSSGGIEFIERMLQSHNLEKISPTLLLILHLLWDEEWTEPLSQMQNPPLEHAALRFAGAAMKMIRDTSYSKRSEGETKHHEIARSLGAKISTGDQAGLDAAMKEMVKARSEWLQQETEDYWHHGPTLMLARAMMVVSAMPARIDPNRLVQAGSFHLVSCCADAPNPDVHGPAILYVHNYMAKTRRTVQPLEFPDPLHIVVSFCRRMSRLAETEKPGKLAVGLVPTANALMIEPQWQPFFQAASQIDDELEFVINDMLPRTARGIPARSQRRNQASVGNTEIPNRKPHDPRETVPRPFGTHSSCFELTGKLEKCLFCGKIESKKGEFKECVRCQVAVYCGRACQKAHWKKHKKECNKVL